MLIDPGEWALVGRDPECDVIADALDAEPPRTIIIAGPSGVGRTRLAREALRLAEGRGRPTRWAAGTAPAARVPLGAFAHLLPALDSAADPLVLLQRVGQAIGGDESGRQPVLGVDDVHLLDPLSVALVHQLAAVRAVTLVLTVRTAHAVPDPAVSLWKDGVADRLELHSLGFEDTQRLITQVLGADVCTRTGQRLWRLTQGSPLFLRELLEDGVRAGRLRRNGGLWRWEGEVVLAQRLAEIVLNQLGDLHPVEWRAMEVLAAAEPLHVDEVVRLSSPDAVAALVRRGLVADDRTGVVGEIRAAHPLYTELIRSRAPEATLREIRRQLATVSPSPGSSDQMARRCATLLDIGAWTDDAELLTAAAQHAIARLDHPLAERLARAGIEAGGGAQAHLALVEAARWQGQPARSETLAVEAAPVTVSDDDRARLAATRALTLFCGLGRTDEAAAVVREAATMVRSGEGRAVLAATEAVLAFLSGDPQRAVRQATSVLTSTTPTGIAQPLAAAAAAAGLALTGRTGEAVAAAESGWAMLASLPTSAELAFVRIALAQAEVMALFLGGRLRELECRAMELYAGNLTAPEWAGDAVACLHRGLAALAGGRPQEAIRWLEEAHADFTSRDPVGLLGVCCSLLAIARARAGDPVGARYALADRGQERRALAKVYQPQLHLAEAHVAAAEERTADAAGLALNAAALARAQGQAAVEALLLHSALRFGRTEVARRLGELAQRIDSPLVTAFALHAEAALAGSGDGLEEASHRFEEIGALLLAGDTAAEAAAAHARLGERHAAARSRTRATALFDECGLFDSSARAESPPALTSREEEVSSLAVQGLTNQAIADRLFVSVRTVEAHLAHVYAKLGIPGRPHLAAALRATAGAESRNPATRMVRRGALTSATGGITASTTAEPRVSPAVRRWG